MFDPLLTVKTITVRYETVCSRCERKVAKGEEAVWYNHQDKREEFRPKRRIVCRTCEPLKRRSSGVKNKEIKPGGGTQALSFPDYLRQRQGEAK